MLGLACLSREIPPNSYSPCRHFCSIPVVLNHFPQWAGWEVPGLIAGWIWHQGLVPWGPIQPYRGSRGQPASDPGMCDSTQIKPCGKKGEWPGPDLAVWAGGHGTRGKVVVLITTAKVPDLWGIPWARCNCSIH